MVPVPETIVGAEVVLYTRIDERHLATNNCRHEVGGTIQGPAAGLAICRPPGDDGYYLIYCDEDWGAITDTWHLTLDDAKHQAEFEYAGVSETWSNGPRHRGNG
jgi:hypothetical protein